MWSTSSKTEDVISKNTNDESKEDCTKHNGPDDKILLMMLKMGYKSGLGLGKNKQGIVKPLDIEIKTDHYGLGLVNDCANLKWKYEEVSVDETVIWFECSSNLNVTFEVMEHWIRMGPKNLNINDEINFCDPDILMKILNAKGMLDQFNEIDLIKARSRSNPFESIKSAFFMNRAALKMANIDACTNFMFTNIDRNPDHQKKDGPYYFADVCAGPGGFSEYILWRKGWGFKGFGLTLKIDNDFKVTESNCASGATFHALYGLNEDGDICRPENVEDFARKVLYETQDEGVHFMMSDGGFSVAGNENLQEVLSKQLYLCQCLVALEIVRENGHFVSKLFDIFTPFSVGLLFLMQFCFITIIKPKTSRPANSERYVVFYGLKKTKQMMEIRKYLRKLSLELWTLHECTGNSLDITDIVPLKMINKDANFTKYITDVNNTLGAKQIKNLNKLITFCKNSNLLDPRQEVLRDKCLILWRIPNKLRMLPSYLTVGDLLDAVMNTPEFMLVQARHANTVDDLNKYVMDMSDWYFVPMNCDKSWNICNFYAAVSGSRVYRLQNHKWIKVKNLSLVSGTILYGEIVKEVTVDENFHAVEKKCLHVIDAMRLGDVSLADLSYEERLPLIKTYCAAVNFETKTTIRIRPKYVKPFNHLLFQCPININVKENKYFAKLSNLCTPTLSDSFIVNSIMLLKVDENQSFKSTYVLRVQININEDQNVIKEQEKFINLDDLLYYLKNKK